MGRAKQPRDASAAAPGVRTRPARFVPRLHWELLVCGIAGHELMGLDASHLYENRDLAVTTDFRDVFGEVVTRHLGLADAHAVQDAGAFSVVMEMVPAEIAGPREEYLPDLAQLVAAKRGEQVKIEEVSNPADPDDALNSNGGLLPGPHATLAGPTFAEWLDAQS